MILIVNILILLRFYYSASQAVKNACCYEGKVVKQKLQANETLYQIYISQKKWPNAIIYYDVDPHMDPVILRCVAKAIDYVNSLSCVQWKQRFPDVSEDPKKHWVTFMQVRDTYNKAILKADVGWDQTRINTLIYVGYYAALDYLDFTFKLPKPEFPELKDELRLITKLIHEMMHTMGFHHEHQRGDRDCWVFVDQSYIDSHRSDLAINIFWRIMHSPKFPYDLNSVLHYEGNAMFYAHDGSPLSRVDGTLSPIDIWKVNYLYCNEPAYCDTQYQCDLDLEEYHYNPKCFREGLEYETFVTCKQCQRTIKVKP